MGLELDYTHVYITPFLHPSVQDTVITKCDHCTLSTLCIQRYRGHNVSSDIGVGSRGGGHQRHMLTLKIDLFGKLFSALF